MKKLACVLALLSGLGCSRARPLTVGSKNFTEQIVLGEIVAQQLERRLGGKVDRKLDLGGTLLAQHALRSGEIALYLESTGTALTAVLTLAPLSDPAAVLERVRAEYRKRWRLEWLDPLGFDNTFAMVVRGPDARSQGIATLTDAARRKQGWTLGVGYEFLQRPDGLAGLLQTYHLPLAGAPKSMDLGLLYSALEQKQVDMAAANATDGMLSVLDVKVLRDDRHYFPPYQAAVIVRAESLAGHPGLRAALDQLAGRPIGVGSGDSTVAARRPALLSALSGSRDRARRKPRRSSRPARGAGPARRQALRRRDARSESPSGWQAPAGRRGGPPVARYHSVRNITFAILLLAARLEPLLHSVKGGEYAESSESVGSGGIPDPLRRVRREKGSQRCVHRGRPGRKPYRARGTPSACHAPLLWRF